MKATVCLIQPPGYVHAFALLEVCQLLCCSLESLGWRCELTANSVERGSLNIVVGYHLLSPADAIQLSKAECVFYQLEQLSAGEGWFNPGREAILRHAHAIWDYSAENVAFLRARGFDPSLAPLGYHPRLRRIRHKGEGEKDVDVLFYGSLNPRRRMVLDRLRACCRVQTLFGVYGAERDAWLARSRVVLNVHFYDAQILEQVRLCYALNNGCFVISEDSDPNPYAGAVIAGAYEALPEACTRYLDHAAAREAQASHGLSWFERHPMTAYLSAVMEEHFGRDARKGTMEVER